MLPFYKFLQPKPAKPGVDKMIWYAPGFGHRDET